MKKNLVKKMLCAALSAAMVTPALQIPAFAETELTELLSNYGKIDILWYDMPHPMTSSEGWDSVNRNNRLRQLQPDMLINNRSKMQEDFHRQR